MTCNENLAKDFNITPNEIAGKTDYDFFPEDLAEKYRADDERIIQSGGIEELEEKYLFEGQDRIIQTVKTAVKDDTGNVVGVLGIFWDITEQRRLEKERIGLEAQLRQAQKMESIGTLAGGIAHDFNNILFPMVGWMEMMTDDIPKDSPLQNTLNKLLMGAKRAGALVDQILAFSRQSEQELHPIKVQDTVREVLKLVRSSLPSTIEIHQHISNQCGLVLADSTEIHQVAMNLITNAYHAMEETGGKLKITLKEVYSGPEDLKAPNLEPGPYVCLTVADTGIGMDNTVMDQIFDPYFTTKATGKGTGLGMAVVHGIVKSYGGSIIGHSEQGKGTVFHVYLPVIKTESDIPKTEAVEYTPKGNERILLVDDEKEIVEMGTQMLERLGYYVTARNSSIDALETFQADPDNFDLVITDMTMPGMMGVQLAQKLTEIRPDIPIILCTGFSDQFNPEKFMAAGFRGYVKKPVVRSELAQKIREILSEQPGTDKEQRENGKNTHH